MVGLALGWYADYPAVKPPFTDLCMPLKGEFTNHPDATINLEMYLALPASSAHR